MKKIILLAQFIMCLAYCADAQSVPPIEWKHCYDKVVIEGADTAHGGGYIFLGTKESCNSANNGDFWLANTDTTGQVLWEQCYDNLTERAVDIIATADGGYIMAGNTRDSQTMLFDIWVIKTDGQGNIVWQKTLGGSGGDNVIRIVKTTDGNYVIGSVTSSSDGDVTGNHGLADIWLIKITAAGTVLWTKAIGSSGADGCAHLNTTQDGGVLVAGDVFVADGDVQAAYGGWVAKVSGTGSLVWQYSAGDSVTWSSIQAVCETKDGGYVFCLTNLNTSPYGGYEFMKIDAAGNVLWQHLKENTLPINIRYLEQAPDSGFIIAGFRKGGLQEGDSSENYYIERTDAQGNKLWSKVYGGSNNDRLTDAIQLQDGGYVLAGYTLSDDIDVNCNPGTYYNGWVVKLQPDPLTAINTTPLAQSTITFYPNPVTDVIYLSEKANVRIINYLGQTVLQEYDAQKIFVNTLSAGNYFMLFSDSKGRILKVEQVNKL